MNRTLLSLAVLCVALAAAPSAFAQVPPPPPVLLVEREVIKPGRFVDHTRESHNFARLLAHAKSVNEPAYTRLGMSPIAGNPNEVLYVYPFASFAQWAQSQQDIERWTSRPGPMRAFFDGVTGPVAPAREDLHVSQQSMIAAYQPSLSLNPNRNLAKARYMSLTTIRVKPGHYGDFLKVVGMYTDALKRMKGDPHFAVYEVTSGGPEATFLIFSPMESAAEMDAQAANAGEFPRAMGDKLDDFEALAARSIESMVNTTYALSPQMSNVPASFHSSDAAFWSQGLPDPPPAATADRARSATNGRRRQR
jgi:hypothetical protein